MDYEIIIIIVIIVILYLFTSLTCGMYRPWWRGDGEGGGGGAKCG